MRVLLYYLCRSRALFFQDVQISITDWWTIIACFVPPVLPLLFLSVFIASVNWSEKAKRRRTQGTGRMRYACERHYPFLCEYVRPRASCTSRRSTSRFGCCARPPVSAFLTWANRLSFGLRYRSFLCVSRAICAAMYSQITCARISRRVEFKLFRLLQPLMLMLGSRAVH